MWMTRSFHHSIPCACVCVLHIQVQIKLLLLLWYRFSTKSCVCFFFSLSLSLRYERPLSYHLLFLLTGVTFIWFLDFYFDHIIICLDKYLTNAHTYTQQQKQQLHKANKRCECVERASEKWRKRFDEKMNRNMKMLSRATERSDSNDSPKQLINFDKLDTEKKHTRANTHTHTHTKPNKPYYSEWKSMHTYIVPYLRKRKKSGKTQIQLLFLTISIIHFFIGY